MVKHGGLVDGCDSGDGRWSATTTSRMAWVRRFGPGVVSV